MWVHKMKFGLQGTRWIVPLASKLARRFVLLAGQVWEDEPKVCLFVVSNVSKRKGCVRNKNGFFAEDFITVGLLSKRASAFAVFRNPEMSN